MASDTRSMDARAKQLLELQKRGVHDRIEQARHMGLSLGHLSRIRGWVDDHGIGGERKPRHGPIILTDGKPLIFPADYFARLTVTLSSTLVTRLRAYCKKENVTIKSAVGIALEHYLKTRPR